MAGFGSPTSRRRSSRPCSVLDEEPDGFGDLVLGDEDEIRRVAERDERVRRRHPSDRPGEATLYKSGDDRLSDPALMAGLVDHKDATDLGRGTKHVADRQRGEPAQVDDADA